MSETIAKDKVVEINYVLKDDAGTLIDESGNEPLKYLHGHGNIIPGLEEALDGKAVGDSIDVKIQPERAYGDRDDKLQQVVEKSAFGDAEIQVGMQIMAETPEGEKVPFMIANIDGDKITIDGNHPLAGLTLHFAVSLVTIRAAAEEEISHGHVH